MSLAYRHSQAPALPPGEAPFGRITQETDALPAAVARHGLVILRGQAASARDIAARLGAVQREASAETGWRHGAAGGQLARFLVAEGGEGVMDLADQAAAHEQLGAWLQARIAVLEWRPSGLPLVTLDAKTDRRALLLDNGVIAGLPVGEAAALRDRLEAVSTDPGVVLRHAWRPGDVLVWDNHRVRYRAPNLGRPRVWAVSGTGPVGARDLATAWVSAG